MTRHKDGQARALMTDDLKRISNGLIVFIDEDRRRIAGPPAALVSGRPVDVFDADGYPLVTVIVGDVEETDRIFDDQYRVRFATWNRPDEFPWIIPLTKINDRQKRAIELAAGPGQGAVDAEGLTSREIVELVDYGLMKGEYGSSAAWRLTAAGNSAAFEIRSEPDEPWTVDVFAVTYHVEIWHRGDNAAGWTHIHPPQWETSTSYDDTLAYARTVVDDHPRARVRIIVEAEGGQTHVIRVSR
jgi:hypothetical protein